MKNFENKPTIANVSGLLQILCGVTMLQVVIAGLGAMGGLTGGRFNIFVAWLLREGQNMQEEQELTV